MSKDGLSGKFDGSNAEKVSIAIFIIIAWYNAVELCVLIFVTFTRYKGLYFWSLLIASILGVIPYSVGFGLKLFELVYPVWVAVLILTIGWWSMITGQSFVLYSRLHLVLRDQVTLRRVYWMIIINVLLLHVPTTILTFASNTKEHAKFVQAYMVMEIIQMTGFFIQEVIISTLYIWETVKMLRLSPQSGNRRIMYQLLTINFIFIFMDLVLLAAAYAELYAIETTLKALVYSIKLKLESAVLGKLIHLANVQSWNPDFVNGSNGYPDFVDPDRITSDVTHPPPCINSPPKPPWSLPEDSLIMMSGNGERQDGQHAGNSNPGSVYDLATRMEAPNGAAIPIDVTQAIRSRHGSQKDNSKWPS